MRLLCILLPHFPLKCEMLRNSAPEETPVAVVYSVGSQKLLLDYSPGLQNLRCEMPVQQALSRHGAIALLQADMPYYWSVFSEVLDRLELISPLVEGRELGEIYIGLDGLQHIYPSNDALVRAVGEAIPDTIEARFGIADNKFLAHLLARSAGDGYRTLTTDVPFFLRDVSCALLPIMAKTIEKLSDFGLKTLGQVGSLSLAHLQAQFGPEGRLIWNLAHGNDDTPLYPRINDETINEETTLTSVTTSLDVLIVEFEALLNRVFPKLEPRGLGISDVTFWTRSWLAEYWERRVYFKEPAMYARAALSRLRQIMENIPQTGPVEQLGLRVTRVSRAIGRQKSIFPEVRSSDQFLSDVRQLEMHLGAPQLFKIKEVEPWSRIPERRYAITPLSQ